MPKFENNRRYSARYILKSGIFSWIQSLPTLTKWIDEDRELFKPIIREGKAGKRYFVKGRTILSILEKANKGELVINPQNKPNE